MEAGALLMMALAGAGYFLNRDGAPRSRGPRGPATASRLSDPLPGSTASGAGGWYLDPHPSPDQNMYEARQHDEVQRALQARADELSRAAQRPAETNVIPSGLGAAIATAGAGGAAGPSLAYADFDPNLPSTRLTEPFHNNMQPFFRGAVRQTPHEEPYANKLAIFTGTREAFQPEGKREVGSLFDPQPNHLPDPGYAREEDRYIASDKRQGEKPFDPEMVRYRPLTNDDYVPPVKDVDELRGPLQPKLNAEGRVIQGRSIQVERGAVGQFAQHRPDRYAAREVDTMLPSRAEVSKPTLHGAAVDRPTHRQALHRTLQGNAGPAFGGKVADTRATVQAPKRINFLGEFVRNLWNALQGAGAKDDFGRKGVRLPPTLRSKHLVRERAYGNVQAKSRARHAENPEAPDTTRREVFVHNRRAGNVKGSQRIRSAGDAPDTTLKETLLHDSQHLNLRSHTYKGMVASQDKARTTVKETSLHNAQKLNLRADVHRGVAAPQDRMRTTVKETSIHDAQRLNLRGPTAPKAQPLDKMRKTVRETIAGLGDLHRNLQGGAQVHRHRLANMDRVRETVRETTTHEPRIAAQIGGLTTTHSQRVIDKKAWAARTTLRQLGGGKYGQGNVDGGSGLRVAKFAARRALLDKARTTHRETLTATSGTRGHLEGKRRGGYLVKGVDAPQTARQTLHTEHNGALYKRDNRGYLVQSVEAPDTARQTLHKDYTGMAGSQNEAQMNRCYAANFQSNAHREKTLEGRAPTDQKAKVAQGADRIHVDPKRDLLDVSALPKPQTRTIQTIPAKEAWGEDSRGVQCTSEVEVDRIDPSLLNAFHSNPFTQSLQSTGPGPM